MWIHSLCLSWYISNKILNNSIFYSPTTIFLECWRPRLNQRRVHGRTQTLAAPILMLSSYVYLSSGPPPRDFPTKILYAYLFLFATHNSPVSWHPIESDDSLTDRYEEAYLPKFSAHSILYSPATTVSEWCAQTRAHSSSERDVWNFRFRALKRFHGRHMPPSTCATVLFYGIFSWKSGTLRR